MELWAKIVIGVILIVVVYVLAIIIRAAIWVRDDDKQNNPW
jgi:hypothetical protein